MKTRVLLVFAAVIALLPLPASALSTEQTERIAASFVLALGRAPTDGEIDQWTKLGQLAIADLIARHRERLQDDAATRRATVVQACNDAFGRAPSDDELKTWSAGASAASTYTELMQRHIQWLADHPADYEQVVQRAYRFLLRREAYAEEVEYWRKQDTLSYALLVGCVEDWARRNQPGLMVTTGIATVSVNSEFLATFRLSPAIAAEARAAAGLAAASGSGRNLVAAGASHITTGGRVHFVAAGRANLVVAGGSGR